MKISKFTYEKKIDDCTALDQAAGANGSILSIMMTEGVRECFLINCDIAYYNVVIISDEIV